MLSTLCGCSCSDRLMRRFTFCWRGLPRVAIHRTARTKDRSSHGRAELIRVLAVENAEQSHCDDLEVEGQTPVAEIVQIVFHAFSDGRVPAPAVDLGPPGDSSLKHVTGIVAVDLLQEALNEMRALGSRSHDAHLAP